MSARLLLTAAILGVIVLHALWRGWRVNRARRSISVAGGAAAVPRIDPGWEAVGAAIWPTRSTVSHAVRARPALRVVLLSLVAGRIRGLRESLKWGAGQLKRSAASLLAAAAVTLAIAAWSDATGLLAVNSGGTLELVKTTDAAVVDAGDEIGFGDRPDQPDLEPGGTFETDVPGCGGRFNLGATGEVARSSLFPGTDEVTETVIGGHAVAIIGLAVVWPIVLGGS
jgi:hypothetical protein